MENKQTSLAEMRSKTLLATFSEPIKLASYQNSLTIEKAINGVQIKKFIKNNGSEVILSKLVEMIIATGMYFGSETHVSLAVMAANDIIDKYPYETLEDLLQAFKMIRRGELTENFDSRKFSVSKIMEVWMPRYFDKKYKIIEDRTTQDELLTKQMEDLPLSQNQIDSLNSLRKGFLTKQLEEKKKESIPNNYLTDNDEIKALENEVSKMSYNDALELINNYKKQALRPNETFKDQLEILEKRLKELDKK